MKCPVYFLRFTFCSLLFILLLHGTSLRAQQNFLLNGGFEDINTCVEYNAECGVEGWFYLKDVKAQMLSNDVNIQLVGNNSFGLFYSWNGYTAFTPVMGTILPCQLQANKTYTFSGLISARLNNKLLLQAGICMGERFYVPRRPFSNSLYPDSIPNITAVPNSNFFRFEYRFVATGKERYLTFGTYIREDTVGAKKKLIGVQTVSLVLDNFQLVPDDPLEGPCADYAMRKEKIYQYDYRHKEMDYSLYGKGELAISFPDNDSGAITRIIIPPPPPKPDTLLLGDVLFDFNKATLKPSALNVLTNVFFKAAIPQPADSIYVEGHTDSIGTDKRNITLSAERCEAVKQWLVMNSIALPEQIRVKPFGKSRPIATNKTPEGRAMNRRVELVIYRKQKL
ncbi:MAG: OmpA family protein [Bacteroidetes bacterium]|nr:OmpA family protein [Bacteroidota bacterium]